MVKRIASLWLLLPAVANNSQYKLWHHMLCHVHVSMDYFLYTSISVRTPNIACLWPQRALFASALICHPLLYNVQCTECGNIPYVDFCLYFAYRTMKMCASQQWLNSVSWCKWLVGIRQVGQSLKWNALFQTGIYSLTTTGEYLSIVIFPAINYHPAKECFPENLPFPQWH